MGSLVSKRTIPSVSPGDALTSTERLGPEVGHLVDRWGMRQTGNRIMLTRLIAGVFIRCQVLCQALCTLPPLESSSDFTRPGTITHLLQVDRESET